MSDQQRKLLLAMAHTDGGSQRQTLVRFDVLLIRDPDEQ